MLKEFFREKENDIGQKLKTRLKKKGGRVGGTVLEKG